jgi:hypothetical protein
MTKRLTYSFAVICLVAGSLHAGTAITAEIPFPFHVGNSILPAGSYTTDTRIASSAVLCLRSADGKTSVMVLSNGVLSASGSTQPRFIFNRYGSEYFLSQVWAGSGGDGHEVVKTRREAELAAAAKRNVQTIVATR